MAEIYSPEQFAIATSAAREVRERRESISAGFLWIAGKVKQLREDESWKAVSRTWGEFCEDSEVGLGMGKSSARSLIAVWDSYLETKLLTTDEAIGAGWGKLQKCLPDIKKIAVSDYEQAKTTIISGGRVSDVRAELRELIPEEKRDAHYNIGRVRKALMTAWTILNDISVEDIDDEFREEARETVAKILGYLVK